MKNQTFQFDGQTATDVNELPDGRTLFKTHTGFRFWVKDKKDEVTQVTEEYWKSTFSNCTTKKSKKKWKQQS